MEMNKARGRESVRYILMERQRGNRDMSHIRLYVKRRTEI